MLVWEKGAEVESPPAEGEPEVVIVPTRAREREVDLYGYVLGFGVCVYCACGVCAYDVC